MTKEAIDDAFCARYGHGWFYQYCASYTAIAREAGIDYDLKDINEIAKKTPYLSKLPLQVFIPMHDVHEAGGVPAIINQLIKKVPLRVIVSQLLVKP